MLRFSDYDVFAYVATGLAAIAVFDLVFSTSHLVRADWAIADGIIVALIAYIIGHILASLANWVLERGFVRHWLGRPTEILLGKSAGCRTEAVARRLVRHYYRPLPPKVAASLRNIIAHEKLDDADDVFWRAHTEAKRDPPALARMEVFLKLYGFSRNIAFVALLGAIGLVGAAGYKWMWGNPAAAGAKLLWAALALAVGIGMFERYLKFYRLFGLEALVTLAHSTECGKK